MARPLPPGPSPAMLAGVSQPTRVPHRTPGRTLTFTAIREEIYVLGGPVPSPEPGSPYPRRPPEAPAQGVDGSGRLVEVRPPRRRSIPRPYLRPELCRFSRAEVLYDMCSLSGTLMPESRPGLWRQAARLLRLARRWMVRAAAGRHLKKWHHLLRNRTPEEQLWEITPPKGFAHLTPVRNWAAKTLADAGYDPERMLVEWEVLWRRRGFT